MRKLLALLLILATLPVIAHADADLAAMSVDELQQLRDAINLELANRAQLPGDAAVWSTPVARVELIRVERGTTKDGAACLAVYIDYTNLSNETDNFRASHWVNLYQNGVEQDSTIYFNDELVGNDKWSANVQPGATLSMRWCFLIPDATATVDLEVEYRANYKATSAGLITVALPD